MITLTREEAQKLLDGFDRVGWARTEHADILRARLAQPEQEPVAHKVTSKLGEYCGFKSSSVKKGDYIYTAPPQREWQGLTVTEIEDAYLSGTGFVLARENNVQQHLSRHDNICFARAIEKTLWEKSNG